MRPTTELQPFPPTSIFQEVKMWSLQYLPHGRPVSHTVLFHTEMPGNCHSYIHGMQEGTVIQWDTLPDMGLIAAISTGLNGRRQRRGNKERLLPQQLVGKLTQKLQLLKEQGGSLENKVIITSSCL